MMKPRTIIGVALTTLFVGGGFSSWLATPAQGQGTPIAVPSGQPISFLEFVSERDGGTLRFRFLTPEIGAGYEYANVVGDFQVLCDEQVMPALIYNDLNPAQIVLSMSAADIPFGVDDPSVLQFFEIFRPENGLCIWEEF